MTPTQRETIANAAAILRDCHTISGQWDNDDQEAKASYDAMLALAARLTPNA